MAHAAVFAYAQALAGGLQLFEALVFAFASLQALGRAFVRSGHGAVARDVFFGFFIGMLGVCGLRKRYKSCSG
jgi:hypothetical protein